MQNRFLLGMTASTLLAAYVCGCNGKAKMENYRKTHESARRVIPCAVEMERLYGTADHFITHYGFPGQETNMWNTTVYFGGRYKLHMQVDVKVDYRNHRVESVVGDPVFLLKEVSAVRLRTDGSVIGAKIGENHRFSLAEWNRVYENKGDYSVIDIQLNRDPVPHFPEYVSGWRTNKIPISLVEGGPAPGSE